MAIPATHENKLAPDEVRVGDKIFRRMISNAEIRQAVAVLAARIESDYHDLRPVFLGVLNGAFMFMAELMQEVTVPCEVSFVKVASYTGTASGGEVRELVGLDGTLEGRHVVIVEDIVDTGVSLDHLLRLVGYERPASVTVATLLFKPECYKFDHRIDYHAFSIPPRFVMGYGLDYDQQGRNLKDIYELAR